MIILICVIDILMFRYCIMYQTVRVYKWDWAHDFRYITFLRYGLRQGFRLISGGRVSSRMSLDKRDKRRTSIDTHSFIQYLKTVTCCLPISDMAKNSISLSLYWMKTCVLYLNLVRNSRWTHLPSSLSHESRQIPKLTFLVSSCSCLCAKNYIAFYGVAYIRGLTVPFRGSS